MTADEPQRPTPQRLAMAGLDVETFTPAENENWKAIRLLDGHVLEKLSSRGAITEDQKGAGSLFYGDWYHAGLAASGVIDPGRVIVDGGQIEYHSDRQMFHLTRWQRAVQAVGLIHSQVLTDVVLNEMPLHVYGVKRYRITGRRSAYERGTASLIDALDALVIHYLGARRRSTMRATHATGYRPQIVGADDRT